jgi:hypothetical protein
MPEIPDDVAAPEQSGVASATDPAGHPASLVEDDVVIEPEVHDEPPAPELPPEGHRYDLSGLAVGPDDRENLHSFASAMHQASAPPEVVKAAFAWYQCQQAEESRAQEQADLADASEVRAQFQSEWSPFEYGMNVQLVQQFLDGLPQPVREGLLSARTAEGKALLNDIEAVRWLTALARGGDASMGGAPSRSAAEELHEIKTLMARPGSAYHKGPDAARLQARYRDLLSAGTGGDVPVPSSGSAIDAEIAKLRKDSAAPKGSPQWRSYWQGPGSARYRQLLQARERR